MGGIPSIILLKMEEFCVSLHSHFTYFIHFNKVEATEVEGIQFLF
jgi:hypothetical protein